MKKLLIYGAAVAVAGLMANTASAVLLSTLIAGNGSLTVGDKTFANFGVSANAPANIDVTVGSNGNGDYFIQFQGSISSGNGGDVDIALQYSVTASGGWVISAIDQSFNFGAVGNGGTVIIAETVRSGGFGGVGVAQSTVGFIVGSPDPNDPPGEASQGDQLSVNPGLTTVFVTKDIHLIAAGAGSQVDATIINQSFHQTIPDGGSTLLLLGGAMSCLSFFGLRRKS